MGVELWNLAAGKQNLVALISVAFLFLLYAFGSVLQLRVINGEEEIVGFIRKFCMHMNPNAESDSNAKAPRLIGIREKTMIVTFYGTIMNTVIVFSTAVYQLDKWGLIGKTSLGRTMQPIVRIAWAVLHAHMGYILWSLTSFLALLFFAHEVRT